MEVRKGTAQTGILAIPINGRKWRQALDNAIHTEMQRISQRLTQRIKELADRYDTPMPKLLDEVTLLEEKVNAHLAKMGFRLND